MEALVGKLAEHGLVGLLLALTLWALYKVFVKYEAVQEARVDDAKLYAEKLSAALDIVDQAKKDRQELLETLKSPQRQRSHR